MKTREDKFVHTGNKPRKRAYGQPKMKYIKLYGRFTTQYGAGFHKLLFAGGVIYTE